MALAIDAFDGHGLSNEMCGQLQPKRLRYAVLAINIATKGILPSVYYQPDEAL